MLRLRQEVAFNTVGLDPTCRIYISYVSQDNFLFQMSIGENIRLGKPDATQEEIIKAAKAACCHDFIMETPRGYDTVVTASGATLSGGERQRVTIARAIIKNAPVIILDEATSFTDPENEDKLQAALNELICGKTVIVITVYEVKKSGTILKVGSAENKAKFGKVTETFSAANRQTGYMGSGNLKEVEDIKEATLEATALSVYDAIKAIKARI